MNKFEMRRERFFRRFAVELTRLIGVLLVFRLGDEGHFLTESIALDFAPVDCSNLASNHREMWSDATPILEAH